METRELFNCSKNQAYNKISKFWSANKDKFSKHYQKYFSANIFDIIDENDIISIDEITKSIFSYLGLLNISHDKEGQFVSFLEQYLNDIYNKNISVFSSDYIPATAGKIVKTIKDNNQDGSVEVFGHALITGLPDLKYFEKPFMKKYNGEDLFRNDILISYTPEEYAEDLLDYANQNDKDLFIKISGYYPNLDKLLDPEYHGLMKSNEEELYAKIKREKNPNMDLDICTLSNDDRVLSLIRKK